MSRRGIAVAVFAGIGIILGVAGIITGLATHSSGGVNCGSVFSPTDVTNFTLSGAVQQGFCNYTMGNQVAPVVTLFVFAGIAFVAAVVIAAVRRSQSQPVQQKNHPEVQAS